MPKLRPAPQRHPAHPGERGAAAVEFAIVLIPLLLLVLGIAEFGGYYSRQLSMQHASREAARHIALTFDDPSVTLGALQSDAEQILVDQLPWIASVAELGDVNPTINLCDPAVTTAQDAVVVLRNDPDLSIPWIDSALLDSVDINARAEMPCEG